MSDSSPGMRGRRFGGNYEVLSFVGQSGGARVYRARQLSMDRVVTLSILSRQNAEKPVLRQRFERQVQAASKLRHPNILSALDAGSVGGHQYIAAEFVGGRRLEAALSEGEWFPARRATQIALSVARALEHVAAVGMLHRNVSPHTILLGDAGMVKLRGFSFARSHRNTGSETWFDAEDWTVPYRAPDWVRETTLDIRADIYSLGCVLFHVLAGRPPFVATNPATVMEMHVKTAAPDVRGLRSDVPASLARVLDLALRKDRDRRYGAPASLVADLQAALDGNDADPSATRGPPRNPFRRRRR